MKKHFLLLLLTIPFMASGQVVNYAKILPERAFNISVMPSFYFDNGNIGLRSIGVEAEDEGSLAIGLSGGYGLQYSLDMNAKFIYVMNGMHFFGIDFQYLLYETRYSYFSMIAGAHYWDNFGVDLTGLFTYSPRYHISFTFGLDLDVNYDPVMDSNIRARVWLPVNVAFNLTDQTLLFAEYNLQVSEWSWGIAAVGANFIIR